MQNNNLDKSQNTGYIFSPYHTKVTETKINNKTVWYKSTWKNLFLKIKHFFKPDSSTLNRYHKILINPNFYKEIDITDLNNDKHQ